MNREKLEQAIGLLIDVNREDQTYDNMQETFAMIEDCWCEETSYWDNKTSRPDEIYNWFLNGYYQCATTTALLNELYGGEVMMGEADGRKHYWNRINGVDVDITRRQFDAGTVITNIQVINKNLLVTDEWMAQRYQALRGRYDIELKKKAIYG